MRALDLACMAGVSSKRVEIRVMISFIMVSIVNNSQLYRPLTICIIYVCRRIHVLRSVIRRNSIYTYVRASIHFFGGD